MGNAETLHLHVLRHAHSSRAVAGQRDHQRPLDDRGVREATALASHLAEREFDICQIVCSTAARALATVEIVRQALPGARFETSDGLYAGGVSGYYVVAERFRACGSLLIVGHNPMIEQFVSGLCARGAKMAMNAAQTGLGTSSWVTIEVSLGDRLIKPGDGYLQEILRHGA